MLINFKDLSEGNPAGEEIGKALERVKTVVLFQPRAITDLVQILCSKQLVAQKLFKAYKKMV
jgi:hypothetical protein